MKNKINMILLTILSVSSFQTFANIFDEQPPNGVSKAQWLSLEQATLEQKLLPTPNGLGGQSAHLGGSFSIDNDRMLVGTGVNAIMFEYDGENWIETQKIMSKPDYPSYNFEFATSVNLSGNRAVVNAYSHTHAGAVYIFEFDGENWVETVELTSPEGVTNDKFGYSVSLSGDRMVVSAPIANIGESYNEELVGVAYIFEFDGNNWIETAKLVPSNGYRLDNFGYTVVLDGDRVLVGSIDKDALDQEYSGAVYVFEFKENTWIETAELTGFDTNKWDKFGSSISLEADLALIGSPGGTAAYLFQYINDNWIQKTKLVDTYGIESLFFGSSVALNGDQISITTTSSLGKPSYVHVFEQNNDQWTQTLTLESDFYYFGKSLEFHNGELFIGSPDYSHNGTSGTGVVHVYKKLGMDWLKSADIVASDSAAFDRFGYEVSLSGNRALVGAYGDNEGDDGNSGSVYFFEYDGDSWINVGKFTGNGGRFGRSVSLSGNSALVGAPDENTGINDSGAVYFYYHNGIEWNEVGKLVAEELVEGSNFGTVVDINNSRAAVSAPQEEAVYIFDFNNNLLQFEQTAKLVKPEGNEENSFARTISLSGDRLLISGEYPYTQDCQILCPPLLFKEGFVYIFEFNGDDWLDVAMLTASDSQEMNAFGYSASLDGDHVIIGAPGTMINDHYFAGAAYIFNFNGNDWVESTKLIASDTATDEKFGYSVSLSGTRSLIGTKNEKVYTYEYTDSLWNDSSQITFIDNESLESIGFGTSVSLSGNRALIGAPSDDEHGQNSGSAYIFNFDLIYLNSFESSVD